MKKAMTRVAVSSVTMVDVVTQQDRTETSPNVGTATMAGRVNIATKK